MADVLHLRGALLVHHGAALLVHDRLGDHLALPLRVLVEHRLADLLRHGRAYLLQDGLGGGEGIAFRDQKIVDLG